jgi:hypothetical protein
MERGRGEWYSPPAPSELPEPNHENEEPEMKYTHPSTVRAIANALSARLDRCEGPALSRDDRVARSAYRLLRDEVASAIERLDALAASLRVPSDADADAITASRMDALMHELADRLPPVRGGGGPDDFEEIDPSFESDPDGWPAFPDPEADGFTYELGPTPIEVLALDEPAWEPSDADWDDMFRMSDASLTEADHMVVHGCV